MYDIIEVQDSIGMCWSDREPLRLFDFNILDLDGLDTHPHTHTHARARPHTQTHIHTQIHTQTDISRIIPVFVGIAIGILAPCLACLQLLFFFSSSLSPAQECVCMMVSEMYHGGDSKVAPGQVTDQ